ncbi:MAG: hypothetical protein NVSMB14_08590 [Isosphaeraceae bacterium]
MTIANRTILRQKRDADVSNVGPTLLSRCVRLRKSFRVVAIVCALAIALGAAVWHRFLFLGNVAVLDTGRLIRTAQPKENLAPLLDLYRPATVLNLRGGSWNDPWYRAEVLEVEKRGLAFYDLPLSASRRPSRKELLLLIDILDRSDLPILVHCKSGSDRTGLATGLYYMLRLNLPPREASARAFSIWRGHIALFGPERLHEPLDEYADWLALRGLPHTAERFRRWVADDYADGELRAKFAPLQTGPRRARPQPIKPF